MMYHEFIPDSPTAGCLFPQVPGLGAKFVRSRPRRAVVHKHSSVSCADIEVVTRTHSKVPHPAVMAAGGVAAEGGGRAAGGGVQGGGRPRAGRVVPSAGGGVPGAGGAGVVLGL